MRDVWVKRLMLGTDVGLVLYWSASAFGVVPASAERVLVDWNWSFLGLDLMVSATGLCSLWLSRRGSAAGRSLMLVSLALTHAAGLTAVNFWALRGEFDPVWWVPNLWLAVFPVVALVWLLRPVRGRRGVPG